MGLVDKHQWTGPTHKRASCRRFGLWPWFWYILKLSVYTCIFKY
jgi:hypothetical protein